MDLETIVQALWLILPAYVANASAVIVGGGLPIDFGKKWRDGGRILGDGKTWRGLFAGAFMGMTAGFGLCVAAKWITPTEYNFLQFENLDFEGFPVMIPIIFSLCFGALMGDTLKSFFKRRIGKKRGENWFIFDQLDFILGALLLCLIISSALYALRVTDYNWFFKVFSLWHLLVILIVTPFVHILANILHDIIGRKRQSC
jgi:CDP-2,3-bis-(O-geranylgeranyl)-sn-glycerol synthase